MNKTTLLIIFSILACLTSCKQSIASITNDTQVSLDSIDYEKRIITILDTLKNENYWQSIPSDFFGRVPDNFDWDKELKEHPYRTHKNNYLKELDSLLETDLSNQFLFDLLKRDYNNAYLKFIPYKTAHKLFTHQTDSAYAAIYHFAIMKPKHYEIAIKLVKSGHYTNEVQRYILEAPDEEDFAKILNKYLHVFDKKTDKQLLDKIAKHVEGKVNNAPYHAYLQAGALRVYHNLSDETLKNIEINKYEDQIRKLGNGKEFEKARNNFWRATVKLILKHHEEIKKSNKKRN